MSRLQQLHNLRVYARDVGWANVLRHLLGRLLGRKHVRVSLPTGGRALIRTNLSDMLVLRQVWRDREWSAPVAREPRTIVDAGANIGLMSLMLAQRFPRARIIAVEPSTANADMVQRNCGRLPGFTLLRAGLWHRPAHLRIANPGEHAWSFRVTECDPQEPDAFPATTLHDLAQQLGGHIDLLKLDIEGAEHELLSHDVQAWLPHVGQLMIELHDRIRPGCLRLLQQALATRPHRLQRLGEYHIALFET